jgi:hypothetical protein
MRQHGHTARTRMDIQHVHAKQRRNKKWTCIMDTWTLGHAPWTLGHAAWILIYNKQHDISKKYFEVAMVT